LERARFKSPGQVRENEGDADEQGENLG